MTAPPRTKVVVAVHGEVPDRQPHIPGLVAYTVLRPHPDEPPTQPEGIGGVALAWLAAGATLAPASWFDAPVHAYRVDERVQIDGDVSPSVVQCSFVRRLPTLRRDEFAAHWSDVHAPLVPHHHPGVARYVQNVVVEPLTPDAPEVDGIAQLSFRTTADFHERYYDSPEGRAIVGADVARFIDRPRGWRLTAQETRLLP